MIPVFQEVTSDTLTPVLCYLRLQRKTLDAFFLESVEGGESIGRFSFIGIDPFEKIEAFGDKVFINGMEYGRYSNPFNFVKKHLSQYSAPSLSELPPFTGGAVGYVGYDSVRFIEKLPDLTEDSNTPDISLRLFQDVLAFDNLYGKIFIISNINLVSGSFEKEFKKAQSRISQLLKMIQTPGQKGKEAPVQLSASPKKYKLRPLRGRDYFEKSVKKIKNYIRSGDIFQCVISDRFEVDLKDHPFDIYRALRSTCPAPYLYFLKMGNNYLLGASPETFVKIEDGKASTRPIAGTRPRGKSKDEDLRNEKNLLASVKERAEHLMLVDLGRNDIGRIALPGSVKVEEYMEVHRYSNVMHLVSLVSGKIAKSKSPWDVFCSCFPAGTLSGAPKIRAMEIISELEQSARQCYGGAVVYHSFSGSFDSCITIRSMFVQGKKGYLQAGAGIVADSRPSFEYDEVLHKSGAIINAINTKRES